MVYFTLRHDKAHTNLEGGIILRSPSVGHVTDSQRLTAVEAQTTESEGNNNNYAHHPHMICDVSHVNDVTFKLLNACS